MSEIFQTHQGHRKKINARWEYAVIFWLIFIAASPFSMIFWLVDMYRRKSIFVDGPCLLYTSPSPRDATLSRMPSSA